MVLTLLSLIGAALGQDVVLLAQDHLPEQVRFHQELALTLDEVKLQPAPEAFARAPMATQLEAVRPMLAAEARQAVVWLDGDAAKLWVSVAFVDKDRAVIRMIDLPRDPDPLPRLALAVRELVATAYTTEPSPEVPAAPSAQPPPVPAEAWWIGGSAGSAISIHSLAGGPRAVLAAQAHREVGRLELGGELTGQLGEDQLHLGLAATGRFSMLSAGVGGEWVHADWALPIQPRLFLGLWHRWSGGLTTQGRVYFHPIRDQVDRGDQRLYDTGWVGLRLSVGWDQRVSTD